MLELLLCKPAESSGARTLRLTLTWPFYGSRFWCFGFYNFNLSSTLVDVLLTHAAAVGSDWATYPGLAFENSFLHDGQAPVVTKSELTLCGKVAQTLRRPPFIHPSTLISLLLLLHSRQDWRDSNPIKPTSKSPVLHISSSPLSQGRRSSISAS